MTRHHNFNCHAFLDNKNLCILEVTPGFSLQDAWMDLERWFLVNKTDLSVRPLTVKSRDCSNSVQEFFFDLGYLKFNSSSDVFIEVQKNGLHPLENKDCDHIPASYLSAIENYLSRKEDKIVA